MRRSRSAGRENIGSVRRPTRARTAVRPRGSIEAGSGQDGDRGARGDSAVLAVKVTLCIVSLVVVLGFFGLGPGRSFVGSLVQSLELGYSPPIPAADEDESSVADMRAIDRLLDEQFASLHSEVVALSKDVSDRVARLDATGIDESKVTTLLSGPGGQFEVGPPSPAAMSSAEDQPSIKIVAPSAGDAPPPAGDAASRTGAAALPAGASAAPGADSSLTEAVASALERLASARQAVDRLTSHSRISDEPLEADTEVTTSGSAVDSMPSATDTIAVGLADTTTSSASEAPDTASEALEKSDGTEAPLRLDIDQLVRTMNESLRGKL